MNNNFFRILFCAVVSTFAAPAPAAAQSIDPVEAFYKGRQIDLFVGTVAGGGYDLYARLLAEHIGNHIPGNPRILVRNMPGAGHLTMTNHVYNVAPKDGSAWAIPQQAVVVEQTMGSPGVHYDARNFMWIGRITPVSTISFTWHASPTKTLIDARNRVTIVGGTGTSSPTVLYPQVLNDVAGTKFKIVSGYKGAQDTFLAIERGELDGGLADWSSFRITYANWLAEKKVNILVQWSVRRAPDMPDVPLALELGTGESEKKVLEFFATGNELGRAFFLPPGTPPERVAVLRKAFAQTMEDARFKESAAKQNLPIGAPFGGEDLHQLTVSTLSMPKDVVERARKLSAR